MFDLIATVLAWFYELVPNYAVAIALLTLSVMVLLTPLTLKGTKSMIQMQRLQPEIKRLQQQYRGDRQKLNEETMKFYQENKINPLGGCLPLLLQMPVFIVLYRVLHKLTQTNPDGTFDPSYISHDSQLYKDLSTSTEMLAFGLDLSHSAAKELGESFVGGLPYLILVLMVTATSYYQQRQISARNTSAHHQPAAADADADHARLLRRHLADAARGRGRVLPGLEPLPDRAAGLHHPQAVRSRPSRGPRDHGHRGRRRQGHDEDQGAHREGGGGREAHAFGAPPAHRRWAQRGEARWGEQLPRTGPRPSNTTSLASDAKGWCTSHTPRASSPQEEVGIAWSGWSRPERPWMKPGTAALDQLGVHGDDAEFEVLEEPRPGLFGRVHGEFRVRARVRPATPRPKVERRDRKKRSGASGDTASESSSVPAGDVVTEDPPAPPAAPRARRAPKSAAVAVSEPKENPVTIESNPAEEAARAASFLLGLAGAFALSAETEVDIDGEDIEVRLVGEDLGLLIGPRGQTLTAIQDLTRTVANRSGISRTTTLRIDIGGYRARRREALTRFTEQVAADVLRTGTAKALEPMSAADRKVVHDTAGTIDGVSTFSEGEEPRRFVVLRPSDAS